MTPWVVWAVAVAVALLIGFSATHFSVRTLRYVTAGIVIAVLVAVTAYGQTPAGGKAPSDLQAAFTSGADRLAAAWFRPLWAMWSSRHAPAPGRLGWSVIAVTLLLGYRQAEKWAMRRQGPELDTGKLADEQPSIGAGGAGPTAGRRHDWLAAEVKFRLAAIDVYSPPVLPGGSRSDGLASIADASGVSGAGLAAAVIRFFGAIWPAPRRYELRVWVEGSPGTAAVTTARAVTVQPGTVRVGPVRDSGDDRAARATRVTVEIDEPRSGRTVASKTIVAPSIDDAASMVAGYVARQVFSRDPASPPWCYGAVDGRDLGGLLLARQERAYVRGAGDVRASRRRQVELLWDVTGSDRCAGVVRYELAQLEDLDREHLTALRLHAMNREQYPRFSRGTYRFCMSLAMVADQGYAFLNPLAARVILDETLDILYRAGLTPADRCQDDDIHPAHGVSGPSVLSHALRETLLAAAQRDLRVIRRQLSFPVVAWSTFRYREERVVWLPHWRPGRRQAFRDGVCVAELLVAVKRRLNERHLARGQGRPDGPGLAERLRQRKGLQVVAAITGDSAAVRAVLREPLDAWPLPEAPGRGPDRRGTPFARRVVPSDWVPPTRDRARWLPWQARTASWQAAYNTACLYAVLVRQGMADEEQVIASLRRVIRNRRSGMERPHDWISNDPDFAPLLRDGSPYVKVRAFLEAQERRDYPALQVSTPHGMPEGRVPPPGGTL